MSFRWKLLLLLLLLGLLPLVVVRAVDALAMRRLGNRVADQTREQMLATARADLEETLNSYALVVDREKRLAETILRLQAEEVNRRLAKSPPRRMPEVYFARDIAGGGPEPPRLIEAPEHGDAVDPGQPVRRVTYATQVFLLAPGVERQAVDDSIAKLAGMSTPYRHLQAMLPELLAWQYTTLANGLHSSFPGKVHYPEDYDPRQRPWYRNAIDASEAIWSLPMADVTTGQTMLTASMPVSGGQEQPVGVTGLDVPLTRILGKTRLHATWADAAETLIVALVPPAEAAAAGVAVEPNATQSVPVVFAEGQREGERDWRKPLALDTLSALPADERTAIIDDMQAGRQRIRSIEQDGRTQLWAYGPITGITPIYVFISVPESVVTAEAVALEEDVLSLTWRLIEGSAVVLLFVAIAVVLIGWRASHIVTTPVSKLSDAARRIASGDLEARVQLAHGRDELHDMADAFNSMVPKLRDRLRMRQSLSLAMEVQQALLPDQPPEVAGLDIAGRSIYCDETGGDYYDFIQLDSDDNRVVHIAIGDVVGHGVSAALLMATARALIRSRAAAAGSISEIFTDVNRHLTDSRFSGQFMTLFYLVLNTERNQMRWLSAGHDPALVYDPGSDSFTELAGRDVPLGIEENWHFQETSADCCDPGQIIVMGTDGIWEARDPQGEMFGKDRLRETIREAAGESADDISRAIQDAVHTFRGPAEQQDDITLVVVKATT